MNNLKKIKGKNLKRECKIMIIKSKLKYKLVSKN